MSGVVLPILIIHLMGDLYATHSVSWPSNWSILGANGLSEMRAVWFMKRLRWDVKDRVICDNCDSMLEITGLQLSRPFFWLPGFHYTLDQADKDSAFYPTTRILNSSSSTHGDILGTDKTDTNSHRKYPRCDVASLMPFWIIDDYVSSLLLLT